MTGLEILFTLNVMALLGFWGWFVYMGFNTSRSWGIALILLFPLSPLMFAYRFERKTRKVIYNFAATMAVFAALNVWIFFATIDFFPNFSHKLAKLTPKLEMPQTTFAPKPTLNLPKPTPIPEPLPVKPQPPVESVKKIHRPVRHNYVTVSLESAHSYIGKEVIISTAVVVHRGILQSVGMGQIEIKKTLGTGATVMGIPKDKIQKIQVYL